MRSVDSESTFPQDRCSSLRTARRAQSRKCRARSFSFSLDATRSARLNSAVQAASRTASDVQASGAGFSGGGVATPCADIDECAVDNGGCAADALSAARRCVAIAPDWPKGHFRAAEAHLALGDRAHAEAAAARAAARRQSDGQGCLNKPVSSHTASAGGARP